jgi:hypothetical protein
MYSKRSRKLCSVFTHTSQLACTDNRCWKYENDDGDVQGCLMRAPDPLLSRYLEPAGLQEQQVPQDDIAIGGAGV